MKNSSIELQKEDHSKPMETASGPQSSLAIQKGNDGQAKAPQGMADYDALGVQKHKG